MSGGKIILLVLVGILISVGSTSLVSAAPPDTDGDADNRKEGMINEIVDTLNHEMYGLEEIKREIRIIEETVLDPVFGLEAIKNIVKHIEDAVFNADFGLEAISSQVNNIQDETDKIQMVKDDVGLIKTETDKIQMVKDDVEDIEGAVFEPNFGIYAQVNNVKNELDVMFGIVDSTQTDIDAIQLEITSIDTETDKIQMVKDDIGTVKNDVAMLKSDVAMIKSSTTAATGPALATARLTASAPDGGEIGIIVTCPTENDPCGPSLLTSVTFDPVSPLLALIILTEMCADDSCFPVFNTFNSFCAGVAFASDCNLIPLSVGNTDPAGDPGWNVLGPSGVGTLTGQKLTVRVSPGYAGDVEFKVWVPVGATIDPFTDL